MKYAIKVKFEDDWIYVSEGPIDDLRVSVMSIEEAKEALEAWSMYGNLENIQIVEYHENVHSN